MDELTMPRDRAETPDRTPSLGSPLARDQGIALWRQIIRVLEQDIAAGLHLPGDKLPTQIQLAIRFRVNRHTVRRALEELSRSGLVHVEQGRGSFVAEDVLDYAVASRTRFSEWIRRHNKEPSGRRLDLRVTIADETVAAGLRLRRGARVIRLERLDLADQRPVSLSTHWFSAVRFPGLMRALRELPTITEALARVGVSDYWRQVTRVTARSPTPQEAELLRMGQKRPILVTENVNVDQTDAVVEYGIGCYPTPRVQIVFEP